MAVMTMLAKEARSKAKKEDNSFGASLTASKAIAEFGADKVIEATLGVIKDENGVFATLPTFEKIYRELPGNELCDYAGIPGTADFREAAIEFTFQGHQPKGTYAKAIATPGGSGAIHHAIYNYVGADEKYLIPDWCWGPYREMGVECNRQYEMYRCFNEDNEFDVDGIIAKSKELLSSQEGLLTFFNTPAHNPSGYTMSNDDWKQLTDFYREAAKDESKRILVLWDMAYTDYAGDKDEVRDFLKYFDDMPENVLLLVAFSMSKSFLIYGMRSGALIGVSTSKEIIDEFDRTITFSNRSTWSNGSRGAQTALAMVMADPALKEQTDKERQEFTDLIAKRAEIFVREAKEVGLPILPYKAGFFVTLPANDQFALCDELKEDLIFSIPLDSGGVRFAMSALPSSKVPGLAAKVMKHFVEGNYQV